MKRIMLFLHFLLLFTTLSAQHLKKDGSPDLRFKENKQLYIAPPKEAVGISRKYKVNNDPYIPPPSEVNSNAVYQSGYYKANGTYVNPYYKTESNSTNHDNYSTQDNINPYTGKKGSRARDYSPEAYNYGVGKEIMTGSRGGQYYINSKGHKTYVPKRY